MARYRVYGSRIARVGVALLAVMSLSALLSAGASSASPAEAPAWRITSVSSPTNLMPLTDEVQQLTVTGAEGNVAVHIPGYNGFFFFPASATAAEAQAAIEAVIGAGNVEVSGGPGDASGSKPYEIKFTGSLAGAEVPQMFAVRVPPEGEPEKLAVQIVTKAGSGGDLVVSAVNVGAGATDGSPVRVEDTLPQGLVATSITAYDSYAEKKSVYYGLAVPLGCAPLPKLECTDSNVVGPGDPIIMRIGVRALANAPASVVNQASVSGGGAEEGASVSGEAAISSSAVGFGIAPGSVLAALSTLQAGAHPNVTTAFTMNTSGREVSAGDPRDVQFDLPAGFVGNTVGMPRCTAAQAVNYDCPPDTIVGMATVVAEISPEFAAILTGPDKPIVTPVFNIEPAPGEPAAFFYKVATVPVRLDTSVLSGGDYKVRVTGGNVGQSAAVLSNYVTVWGVPADHEGPGGIVSWYLADNQQALKEGHVEHTYGSTLGGVSANSRVPLLTNPTQCSTPLSAEVHTDSWVRPGVFVSPAPVGMGVLSGCGRLGLEMSMSMLPDTLVAGAPAGYTFGLHIPQANVPDGLATPNVKRVVTTLPMGTVISPSAAWGLAACSDAQFAIHSGVAGSCPREAQVGTVQITTPALPQPLAGKVFLAAPDCGPCSPSDAQAGRMVRLFMQVIGEGESGIIVKLEGTGSINQQTGQLTVTFDQNPQLPFSDLKLTLGGGPRATLANPRACGPVSTSLDLTPWSTPFGADVSALSTFEISEGCFAPIFKPSFVAGTTDIQAGEYTPFTVSFGREDDEQFLNGLQMQMPPGLLGSLAGVSLCKEPQAAMGTCGQASLIGHTQVLTGPGADPFLVTGGQVFLTESYRGAPFGLSIVVPAKAGPYTLAGTTGQGTVVVRAAINVDPNDAALTVTSDPLPTMLDGIPLQLRVVNVTIDRPNFTLNPTNCQKMTISGVLSSTEGPGVSASTPFQVTNCAGLGFKPRFNVSTSGHTSRARGASLDAKVTYPTGGRYANIAKVKVDLPKQLPSRLTTLQKACPVAIFNANPAACPAGSRVGIAKAITPILPVTLTGPVYFVSHGGEAFPNLIIVLQGYGVRVDLVGDTFISKAGITSSTFEHVPDVPIDSFELYLPQGPGSALAANGNLCTSKLVMPTSFIAQNGMSIKQSTPIAVTGCNTKAKKARRARMARAQRKHRTRGARGGAAQSHAANGRSKR
jgi:hypothetical protein